MSAFGPSEMNQRAAGIRNGRTSPTHHAGSTAVSGGETRHSPGSVPCGNGYGVPAGSRPSCSRARSIAAAAASPAAIPRVFARPSSIAASESRNSPAVSAAAADTTPPVRGTRPSPRPPRSTPARAALIRLMAVVDRVDRAVDGAMDHREAQRRRVRRRAGGEDRALRVQAPIDDRIAVRHRRRGREGDERADAEAHEPASAPRGGEEGRDRSRADAAEDDRHDGLRDGWRLRGGRPRSADGGRSGRRSVCPDGRVEGEHPRTASAGQYAVRRIDRAPAQRFIQATAAVRLATPSFA